MMAFSDKQVPRVAGGFAGKAGVMLQDNRSQRLVLQPKTTLPVLPVHQFTKKKKTDWRSNKIDRELKAAKKTEQIGGRPVAMDTGHHKLAKSKLLKIYPHLDDGEKRQLNVNNEKALMSLPFNLTFGPNSSQRSDDPGSGFDANYDHASGAMTPRSARLSMADREIDRGKLSHMTTAKGTAAGAGMGGILFGGLGYLLAGSAGLLGLAGTPLLAATGIAGLAGAAIGGYLGYGYGSKKQRESKNSKAIIIREMLAARHAHGNDALDPDTSMWEQSAVAGKVQKRR